MGTFTEQYFGLPSLTGSMIRSPRKVFMLFRALVSPQSSLPFPLPDLFHKWVGFVVRRGYVNSMQELRFSLPSEVLLLMAILDAC